MAGEMIDGEMQVQFNGWSACFASIDGVRGISDVAAGDVVRGRSHGMLPGPQFMRSRVITAEVPLVGQGEALEALADDMAAANIIDGDEMELSWRLRGDTVRMVWARCRRRSIPINEDYSVGVGRAVIQWVATDPRIYGTDVQQASTTPGGTVGGLGFPHGFPHGFGEATSGTVDVTNDGTAAAPWTATLTGPLTSPRIRLLELDGELALSGFDLPAGQTLELDSLNRTVLLNGTASRYGSLTTRDWFDIPPGGATIGFSASSGAGSLSMAWRDTWL